MTGKSYILYWVWFISLTLYLPIHLFVATFFWGIYNNGFHFCCYGETKPTRSNLREERFILLHSLRQHKSLLWGRHEGRNISHLDRWRSRKKIKACRWSAISFLFIQFWNPPLRMVPQTFMGVLSPWADPFWKGHYRHAQKCTFLRPYVSPNPVKVAIKITITF